MARAIPAVEWNAQTSWSLKNVDDTSALELSYLFQVIESIRRTPLSTLRKGRALSGKTSSRL